MPVTFKVALAGVVLVMVVPPPVEESSPAGILLMRFPGVVEVTSIDTVHDPGVPDGDCSGTVPPVKDNVVPPGEAATEPPQVLIKFTGSAMMRPGWTPIKLSAQEALVSGNPLGLKMVTLSREVPPAAIEIGSKLLLISAGREICAYTVCAGTARMETISTTTKREMIDLRIFVLLKTEKDD